MTEEFNPQTNCTEFISQRFDDARLFMNTELQTPEAVKYMNYLETLGDDETFKIPSASKKARRIATMNVSLERKGRWENVFALVGHPREQSNVMAVGTLPYTPIAQVEQPTKKKGFWRR